MSDTKEISKKTMTLAQVNQVRENIQVFRNHVGLLFY